MARIVITEGKPHDPNELVAVAKTVWVADTGCGVREARSGLIASGLGVQVGGILNGVTVEICSAGPSGAFHLV